MSEGLTRTKDSLRRIAGSGYTWVLFVGLLLRLVYLAEAFRRNELIAEPLVDARVYVDWSRDILAGKWLWFDPMHYTPAVPLWIAGWTALLGWHPAAHFAVFHLLGAIQAVIVGRTAELLWDRRVGLVTAALAATYWPLIVFEATYYAEAFAIFNLSLALFLTLSWSRKPQAFRPLIWAGFTLGWSILARANAILCAPIFAGWVFWKTARETGSWRGRRAITAVLALLIPPLVLCAPVLFWNWKLTGRPMLRTGGWMSVYLGNNPEYRALVVPVGVRWTDFAYQSVRAGYTETVEKSDYWQREVFRILRERPRDWIRLMGRKVMMLIGRFEVSQEIDVGIFRNASRVLSLPVWPGWGTIAPLALFAAVAMLRSTNARHGILLLLCAAAYFLSIAPVQVSVRYRLPIVVPLMPLAGWALVAVLDAVRQRDKRMIKLAVITIGASGLMIWPDWLGLRHEKIINHSFLTGLKRMESGDEAGALAAFEAGAAWNPADPDCPLRMADIWLARGDVSKAEPLYLKARENFPRAHRAVLGLGECALVATKPEEALKRVGEALEIAPNNMDALGLASRAYAAMNDWTAMARTCEQMRSYPTHPASVDFTEAWALTLAGRSSEAVARFDAIAQTTWFSAVDRTRAAFLGGALAARVSPDRTKAMQRWQWLVQTEPSFFQALAKMLTGEATLDATMSAFPKDMPARLTQYVEYAIALKASLDGNRQDAQRHFERVIAARDARNLPPAKRELLEIWAMEDLEKQ